MLKVLTLLRSGNDAAYEERTALPFALFVVSIAFLVYVNSIGNGFVSDDHSVIINSPVLRGDSLSLFHTIDTTSDTLLLPYYRPFTYLTFLAEQRLHGFDPRLMHMVNVLLHVANTLLVFVLARSMIANSTAALLAALIHATHPINAEAVNFLSGGRNTLLACFFSLSAYLVHLKGRERDRARTVLAGSVLFLAGLFSKESGMMIFPFIIALEMPGLRNGAARARMHSAAALFPYAAAAGLYLFLRWQTLSVLGIQTGIIPGFGEEQLEGTYIIPGIGSRLLDNLYIVPRYLFSLLWPFAMSPRYMIPEDMNLLALPLAAAWIFIAGVIVCLLTMGRDRVIFFGILWALAFWLPVSGLFYFSSVSMADRFLYLPAIGIWLIVAVLVVRLKPRTPVVRRRVAVAVAVLLLLMALLSIERNMDWKDDLTLFSRLVQQYPENPYGHFNLASAYIHRRAAGDLALAERELTTTLSLDPDMQDAFTPMGLVKLERGDFEDAIYYYTRALDFFPLDRDARINRAIAYENLNKNDEALADYRFYLSITTYNNIPGSQEHAERKVRELSVDEKP